MCYVCCKELKGWCKSFTRTEGILSIVEGILLVVLLSFLVFLILHFVACRPRPEAAPGPENNSNADLDYSKYSAIIANSSSTRKYTSTTSITQHSTLVPDIECTWERSRPTTPGTRYFLSDRRSKPGTTGSTTTSSTTTRSKAPSTKTAESLVFGEALEPSHEYDDDEFLGPSDGELAENRYNSQVVALVKLKPPGDVTFGCILTKITKFWTLTAASCIASIEDVDSLDSFVIMEEFGEPRASRPRSVTDVRLHPLYQGSARAHDLAALRADRALRAYAPPLRLPRLLDYFLVALGESFHILGYGRYRSVDSSSEPRRLRQVSVFVLKQAACASSARASLWAPRHLVSGAHTEVRHGACGAAALCAGALWSRGSPCNYCAGAPLLRDDTLFGVMSDNSACGVACEPQLYVNIATLRDWIDSIIE